MSIKFILLLLFIGWLWLVLATFAICLLVWRSVRDQVLFRCMFFRLGLEGSVPWVGCWDKGQRASRDWLRGSILSYDQRTAAMLTPQAIFFSAERVAALSQNFGRCSRPGGSGNLGPKFSELWVFFGKAQKCC